MSTEAPKEHRISFAKKEGAGVTTAVTPPPTNIAPAASVTEIATPPSTTSQIEAANSAPAADSQLAAPAAGVNSLGFYDGSEEMPESSSADKRTPWLQLIQPTTKDKVVGDVNVKDGTFVYKKAVVLPQPFRAVVVGFRPKVWVEKLKYVQNPSPDAVKARIAKTLAEVASFGGTDQWKFSNQNKNRSDVPLYQTPFFEAHITALLLIECPEGADDSHFPLVVDGKAYGPALFEFKGTSFSTGFVPINTERAVSLQGKWCSRFVHFTSVQSKKNPAFFVVTKVTDPTSTALQELIAKEIR